MTPVTVLPRQPLMVPAQGLGSAVSACSVGAGKRGWVRKVSRLPFHLLFGLDVSLIDGPTQLPGSGKEWLGAFVGSGWVPNSSNSSICWVKGLAPKSGVGGASVGTLNLA